MLKQKQKRGKKWRDVFFQEFNKSYDITREVDEKLLYDAFSTFGIVISTPKIMRDESGTRCYAFLSFDNFESSDASIASMNGQYLAGRAISVTYALKKDSKTERHGGTAERILAARNPSINNRSRPNQMFSGGPPAGFGGGPSFAPPYPHQVMMNPGQFGAPSHMHQ